jgi:hopanoid-associated phosphorylase
MQLPCPILGEGKKGIVFVMTIGVATGMASEARLLRDMGVLSISAGGDPTATRAGIEDLIRRGADRLVSFGIAGALDPGLKPGDLVVGSVVRDPAVDRFPADQKWLLRAAAQLPGAIIGDVLGSSGIVASAREKAILHRDTGAKCVDQESHWVAQAARAHGLPFIVLRAIADRARDQLPPAVLAGLDTEGNPRPGAVVSALLREPSQIGALIRVAFATRTALKALFRGRAALLV